MQIFEVGGGNGTLAANVLGYFSRAAPSIYRSMRYTSIEISATMAQQQRLRCEPHAKQHTVWRGSALEWNTLVSAPCFVIATEVLDNMPQYDFSLITAVVFSNGKCIMCLYSDKLQFRNGQWMETVIREKGTPCVLFLRQKFVSE